MQGIIHKGGVFVAKESADYEQDTRMLAPDARRLRSTK